MVVHYDPRLREKIPGHAETTGVGLNAAFRDFEELVLTHIRPPPKRSKAKSRGYKALLARAEEHAATHQRAYTAERTVLFVHPLYLHLSNMNYLKTAAERSEADIYLDKFFSFLQGKPDRTKVGIVALETPYHYAASTSTLLEEGLIDRVIFTQYDEGYPLSPNALYPVAHHTLFLAGCYNNRCLGHAFTSLEPITSPSQLWAIRDLTLTSPQDAMFGTLQPSSIIRIPRSRTVSLDVMVTRLGL